MEIFINDTSNLRSDIQTNDCFGNIQISSLRRHLAIYQGHTIENVRKPDGSIARKLNSPDPLAGEQFMDAYIRTGTWKYVVCENDIQAGDFRYYAIQQLLPVLNIDHGAWNQDKILIYPELLQSLLYCEEMPFAQLNMLPTNAGVYIFSHVNMIGSI